MSTIRGILARKEYLGYTVLHKSVNTNFMLHKRKATSPDEQYVFPNTHEPIISQALWDNAQRMRKKANRTNVRGTHHHRLSGYVFCADCGRRMTLQSFRCRSNPDEYIYSFRCGGYVSKVNSCTIHTIEAAKIEALILATVQRISRLVLQDEEAFAQELEQVWKDQQIQKPQLEQSELRKLQKRYDEVSGLVQGLYENFMSGLLPERQYRQLMKQYDQEQADLEDRIDELTESIALIQETSPDTDHFIRLIRQYKEPTEITDFMFRELIDKIVVYEAEGTGRNRTQKVDIYFNYVGTVNIAYTEEELGEMKAAEEREAAERLARQRQREKAYREKRKAKKLAENGGPIVNKKICPVCGKEYIPSSNRQIYCSNDCWQIAYKEKKEEIRQEERGDHLYRKRVCTVCGKEFWPVNSQQKRCSDECKRIHHNQVTLDFYHKKQSQKNAR